ncbi:hypothetical protein LOTGIDRAFT_176881, partial [Lottia gigantea]
FINPKQRLLGVKDVLEVLDANNSDLDESDSDSDVEDDLIAEDNLQLQNSIDLENESGDEDTAATDENLATPSRINFTWRKCAFEPTDVPFRGAPICALPDGEISTPYDYFSRFISRQMLENTCLNSNEYCMQKNGIDGRLTIKELEQVIGMYLRMGIVQMPGNRVYWERDTRYAPVADVMSRNRFQHILTILHFKNNLNASEVDKNDKIWKVRP